MYGALLSPPDERDYQAKDYLSAGTIPAVYIPEHIAPILNQGGVNSCVGHAIATMLWYFEGVEYSTDDTYHDREIGDYQGQGMYQREALKKNQKRGCVLRAVLPSNTEYPNQEVDKLVKELYSTTQHDKIATYFACQNTDELRAAIYQNKAAVITIQIPVSFTSFYYKPNLDDAVLPLPKEGERYMGYHAVCAIGYNERGIIIQNSWGEAWGCQGLAVLPYDYAFPEMWSVTDETRNYDTITMQIGNTEALISGEKCKLDVPAVIIGGRTMVPIRFIAEALGCEVDYVDKTKTVIIKRGR